MKQAVFVDRVELGTPRGGMFGTNVAGAGRSEEQPKVYVPFLQGRRLTSSAPHSRWCSFKQVGIAWLVPSLEGRLKRCSGHAIPAFP